MPVADSAPVVLLHLIVWPVAIVLVALTLKVAWYCIRGGRWLELSGLVGHALLLATSTWDVILNYGGSDRPWQVAAVIVAVVLSFGWVVAHLTFPERYWPSRRWIRVKANDPDRRRHRVDAARTR